MAVLKYYNTATSAWEYIAASTTANFTTWKKTMAGGETSVSGTDDNGVTLSYTVGLEQVFINGALQARGSDYTATTGTTVTGLSALGANDIVSVVCYAPFNVTNTYTKSETDSLIAAAPGMSLIIPSSVAVGSGTASIGTNGSVTFSGCSSVSLNNVFSATYDFYRMIINVQPSTTLDLSMRYRVSGSDDTNANYNYEAFIARANNANASVSSATNQTSFIIAGTNSGNANALTMDIYKPFNNDDLTKHSTLGHMHDSTSYIASFRGGVYGANTRFDGLTIFNGGTMTGSLAVYGYKK
jgi:hypothetical protein